MSLKASEQNIKIYAPAKGVRVKVVNMPQYEDDVYHELMKQMTAGSEDAHKPEVTTDEEQAQPAESEK